MLEEQYTLLETCAWNLDSILINTRIKESVATIIVNQSLAFRIAAETLIQYLSLLYYPSGVHNTHGWNVYKSQLKLYTSNNSSIKLH